MVGSQGSTPPDDLSQEADILVIGRRYGDASVEPETEFDEDEIASLGSDSINALLERLSPFIDGSGEELVVLVNGKEIGFDRSILS